MNVSYGFEFYFKMDQKEEKQRLWQMSVYFGKGTDVKCAILMLKFHTPLFLWQTKGQSLMEKVKTRVMMTNFASVTDVEQMPTGGSCHMEIAKKMLLFVFQTVMYLIYLQWKPFG